MNGGQKEGEVLYFVEGFYNHISTMLRLDSGKIFRSS